MFRLIPKGSEDELIYILEILQNVADALTSVLGSTDQELLNPPDTRSGFMYIAIGMRDTLAEASSLAADKLGEWRATKTERDNLKAELEMVARAYDYLEAKYYATPGHTPLDLSEAATFFKRRKEGKAPDLTEPAEPATGVTAAKAG